MAGTAAALAFLATLFWSAAPAAAHDEDDFALTEVIGNLDRPTAVEIAPTGDVFVIEKNGIVKAFDGLGDGTADVVVDWRSRTMHTGDQGMLGLAVDPLFGAGRNYIYVHYVLDEIPGENDPPHWGDNCPVARTDGCVVTATLARIEVDPTTHQFIGSTDLLTSNTCLQFNGHSSNDLAIGPDGYLYAAIGDGASFTVADYGQLGDNPCQDPPYPDDPTPATSEGGALRAMDLLTSVGGEANDPVWYNGVVLRIDPDTGAAAPGNPLNGVGVSGDDRIIAHGLRNPWRIDFRPGTDELWIADVGWTDVEELNVIADVDDGVVEHFGWPCYEGPSLHAVYSSYGLCQTLLNDPGSFVVATEVTDARLPYAHSDTVGTCPGGTSAVAGVAFAGDDGPYPDEYDGALFFSDYARSCLWAMVPDANGVPDVATIDTVATGLIAVDLDITPDGELLVVEVGDFSDGSGRIRRLDFLGGNLAPTAVIEANTLTGTENVTRFEFDGTQSSDPEGGALRYDWDLDGDGTFDAAGPTASIVYAEPGSYEVLLRVTDPEGASGEATVIANVSNTSPVATIVQPGAGSTWRVGDGFSFSGSGSDAEDGPLSPDTPGQEWEWRLILHHCPDDCHQHIEGIWSGIGAGSFATPDHEYPSWLELVLTVYDSTGASGSASVELQPLTSTVTLETSPAGLQVAGGGGGQPQTAPFEIEAIELGSVSIVAPSPQTVGGTTYAFRSWSDGGARIHDVVVPLSDTTITATFDPLVEDAFGFRDGWTPGGPTEPWSYWWNESGPLGDAGGYSPLLWNGTWYDADGIPGHAQAGGFAYGSIQAWGGHPGRSTAQQSAEDRHAIIRFTAGQAGNHRIIGSEIADIGCVSGGVDLTVLVNDAIVSTQQHSGPAPGSFDRQLGMLAAGDTIDVAIGPGAYDYCDATDLDFYIAVDDSPPPATIVADYRDDFAGPTPVNGWSYLWNQGSSLGDSSGYQVLQWNTAFYDSDGERAGPSPDNFSYGRAASWGVHPGRSVAQGAGVDRHVILRHTTTAAGAYAIVDSMIEDVGCASNGVELAVLVDDAVVAELSYDGGPAAAFDVDLGNLAAGTAIDVAVGPGAYDTCDAVGLDFSIEHTAGHVIDPPVTIARYGDDFTGPVPATGWSYHWNETGPIGDAGSYRQLLWNTISYDSDGQIGAQSGDDFVYGQVARWGVHPGRGTSQSTAHDRFAIVRYTVPSGGSYGIDDSVLRDRHCPSGGVELQVRVNDALVSSLLHSGSSSATFDAPLGPLSAGDTIDVAVGPDGLHVCDAVDLDFSITRQDTPP